MVKNKGPHLPPEGTAGDTPSLPEKLSECRRVRIGGWGDELHIQALLSATIQLFAEMEGGFRC